MRLFVVSNASVKIDPGYSYGVVVSLQIYVRVSLGVYR